MSVEKMTFVTLTGPVEQFDTALGSCIINKEFHPENAINTMQAINAGSAIAHGSGKSKSADTESFQKIFPDISLAEAEAFLNGNDSVIKSRLGDMGGLLNMRHLKSRFGRLPLKVYEEKRSEIDASDDFFFTVSSQGAHYVYCVYLTPPKSAEASDTYFSSLGFEPIYISSNSGSTGPRGGHLVPFDARNPYGELLEKAVELMGKAGVAPGYSDFTKGGFTADNTSEYLKNLDNRFSSLEAERDGMLLEAEDNAQVVIQLDHIRGVEENIQGFFDMENVKFRFGRIPRGSYDDIREAIMSRNDFFYVETSLEHDYAYGMYFVLPVDEERVDAYFTMLNFERVWISQKVKGTPQDAAAELQKASLELRRAAASVEEKISALKSSCGDELLARYAYLRFMNDSYSLRAYAAHSEANFYITGWVPRAGAEAFKKNAEQFEGFTCLLSDPEDVTSAKPPIKVKQNFMARIFSPFLEMYGLPSYNEIDPGFFLAFTYTILFGMMYGDVGHGCVLILVGILMYKLKGMWLGRILSCIGCSSVLFGFIYGSIFGFEDVLPFGFHVLEEGNTLTALYIAIGLGIVIILACMALNMINGIKQKNIEKIFFSPNGIPGFMIFAYLGVGVLLMMFTDIKAFTTPFILVFIALPIALMFFKTPLVCLCTGQKWKPESIAMFIVESFFELFETFLSYISNVLSFLRVAAYAISHAGMMMVVFLLAQTAAGGHNPVVLILGNIVVIGLEGLLACIQALRLEFYEMFGRFYDDGGKPFKPCIIDYSSVKAAD